MRARLPTVLRVGQHVLGGDRGAAHEARGCRPGRTGARPRRPPTVAKSCTSTWPGQRDRVGQDRVVAHRAVVGHVRLGHEQVVRADPGHVRRRPASRGGRSTNSRNTLRSPISSRVASPRYFRSCGASPTDAEREEVVVARRCGCRRRSRRATRARCRARAAPGGPTTAVGSDAHARPEHGAGSDARERVHLGRGQRRDLQQQARLRHARARPRAPRRGRGASSPRRCSSFTSRRSWSPGTTGRRNFASSMPTTWTSSARGSGAVLQQPDARPPGPALSMSSTPGHHRLPREVALEELLGAGDVLRGDQPPARVVLEDAVHEHERVLGRNLADEPPDRRLCSAQGLQPRLAAACGVRAWRAAAGGGLGAAGAARRGGAEAAGFAFSRLVRLRDHVARDVEVAVDR